MRRCVSDSGAGKAGALFGGIGIGAVLMFVLDPDRGHRRRAMARDRAFSLANKTARALASTSRDLSNRARGAAWELRSAIGRRGIEDSAAGNVPPPAPSQGGAL